MWQFSSGRDLTRGWEKFQASPSRGRGHVRLAGEGADTCEDTCAGPGACEGAGEGAIEGA